MNNLPGLQFPLAEEIEMLRDSVANFAVADHRVRTNSATRANSRLALQLHVWLNDRIGCDDDVGIETLRQPLLRRHEHSLATHVVITVDNSV